MARWKWVNASFTFKIALLHYFMFYLKAMPSPWAQLWVLGFSPFPLPMPSWAFVLSPGVWKGCPGAGVGVRWPQQLSATTLQAWSLSFLSQGLICGSTRHCEHTVALAFVCVCEYTRVCTTASSSGEAGWCYCTVATASLSQTHPCCICPSSSNHLLLWSHWCLSFKDIQQCFLTEVKEALRNYYPSPISVWYVLYCGPSCFHCYSLYLNRV